jgi:hypothetical protein
MIELDYKCPCSPRHDSLARSTLFWPSPSTARPDGQQAQAGPAWWSRPCLGPLLRHVGWHSTARCTERGPASRPAKSLACTTNSPIKYICTLILVTLTPFPFQSKRCSRHHLPFPAHARRGRDLPPPPRSPASLPYSCPPPPRARQGTNVTAAIHDLPRAPLLPSLHKVAPWVRARCARAPPWQPPPPRAPASPWLAESPPSPSLLAGSSVERRHRLPQSCLSLCSLALWWATGWPGTLDAPCSIGLAQHENRPIGPCLGQ